MAEPTPDAQVRRALLADVDAGRVIDDDDFTPQPTGTRVWQLTAAGRAELQGGAS